VYAKSTYISTGFATNPEDGHLLLFIELDEFALVDCSDSQVALDGGDDWRSLKQGTAHCLQGLGNLFSVLNRTVETNNTNVLFTCYFIKKLA